MPRNQSFDSPGMLGNLPMHAPPLSLMNVGSGGMGMPMGMGVPAPFAAAGAQFGPLIRMGGSVPVQDSPVAARRGARASERSEAPLGSRLGPAPPANDLVMSEPLPEPPRPLDPVSRSGAALRARELTVSFSASTRRAEAIRGPGQRGRRRGRRARSRVLARCPRKSCGTAYGTQ
jgi:hypothetical protein